MEFSNKDLNEIKKAWFEDHIDDMGRKKGPRRNERIAKNATLEELLQYYGGNAAYISYLKAHGIEDPYALEGFEGDLTDAEMSKRALKLV